MAASILGVGVCAGEAFAGEAFAGGACFAAGAWEAVASAAAAGLALLLVSSDLVHVGPTEGFFLKAAACSDIDFSILISCLTGAAFAFAAGGALSSKAGFGTAVALVGAGGLALGSLGAAVGVAGPTFDVFVGAAGQVCVVDLSADSSMLTFVRLLLFAGARLGVCFGSGAGLTESSDGAWGVSATGGASGSWAGVIDVSAGAGFAVGAAWGASRACLGKEASGASAGAGSAVGAAWGASRACLGKKASGSDMECPCGTPGWSGIGAVPLWFAFGGGCKDLLGGTLNFAPTAVGCGMDRSSALHVFGSCFMGIPLLVAVHAFFSTGGGVSIRSSLSSGASCIGRRRRLDGLGGAAAAFAGALASIDSDVVDREYTPGDGCIIEVKDMFELEGNSWGHPRGCTGDIDAGSCHYKTIGFFWPCDMYMHAMIYFLSLSKGGKTSETLSSMVFIDPVPACADVDGEHILNFGGGVHKSGTMVGMEALDLTGVSKGFFLHLFAIFQFAQMIMPSWQD